MRTSFTVRLSENEAFETLLHTDTSQAAYLSCMMEYDESEQLKRYDGLQMYVSFRHNLGMVVG